MIDRLIPMTILAGIAALIYTAVARTDGHPQWRTALTTVTDYIARQRAWRNGDGLDQAVTALADLHAGTPEPGTQPRCPRCHGRRCRPFRDGLDCGPQRAPSLSTALAAGGRHEAWYRTPVRYDWTPPRPTWSSLTDRVGALPRIGVLP